MNYPKNKESALKWDYKFWDTQPVLKLNEIVSIDSQIEQDKQQIDIKENPFELPVEFEWKKYDLNVMETCETVATFLDKYYVEDKNHEFRLHYSAKLIEWLYKNSNNIAIGVNVRKNNVLAAFICGKVVKTQVNRNKLDMIEVNLLCIHPNLRSKRLAPVLIKELSRQFNLLGYSKGLYTAGNYLPTPILTTNYYHKAINVKTLHETGFFKLDPKTPIKNVIKAHQLPEQIINKNFKQAELKHSDEMYTIFNKYMEKYNLHPLFTKEEFNHIFFENEFVVCYVIENESGNVLDFISYYIMQSRVLKHNEKHKFINKAHLYYYTSLNNTPYLLIKDMLIVARNNGMDVFDATDIMENNNVLTELGFEHGTGVLNYYLYNWKIKPIKNLQCSLLLM